jgi:membrane-bound ClpP family serine protease
MTFVKSKLIFMLQLMYFFTISLMIAALVLITIEVVYFVKESKKPIVSLIVLLFFSMFLWLVVLAYKEVTKARDNQEMLSSYNYDHSKL